MKAPAAAVDPPWSRDEAPAPSPRRVPDSPSQGLGQLGSPDAEALHRKQQEMRRALEQQMAEKEQRLRSERAGAAGAMPAASNERDGQRAEESRASGL